MAGHRTSKGRQVYSGYPSRFSDTLFRLVRSAISKPGDDITAIPGLLGGGALIFIAISRFKKFLIASGIKQLSVCILSICILVALV